MVDSISIKKRDCYRSSSIYCFILRGHGRFRQNNWLSPFYSFSICFSFFKCYRRHIWVHSYLNSFNKLLSAWFHDIHTFCVQITIFLLIIVIFYWRYKLPLLNLHLNYSNSVCFTLSYVSANNQFAWSTSIQSKQFGNIWKSLSTLTSFLHINFFVDVVWWLNYPIFFVQNHLFVVYFDSKHFYVWIVSIFRYFND